MYFAKNEIIELNNGERFLILDSVFLDDTSYYKIEKIENDNHTDEVSFISAINNEGKLYINRNLDKNIVQQLSELC